MSLGNPFLHADQHWLNRAANVVPPPAAKVACRCPVKINPNPRGTAISHLCVVGELPAAPSAHTPRTSILKPKGSQFLTATNRLTFGSKSGFNLALTLLRRPARTVIR